MHALFYAFIVLLCPCPPSFLLPSLTHIPSWTALQASALATQPAPANLAAVQAVQPVAPAVVVPSPPDA
ncbi:hypothetical protein PMIN01_04278 [Paraphaeosphaeria minitans]|uniref:Uncharacterized protein n=1 Tax=Paraphaeosphaeria minitans TaxID=565426 RepID=A0A9P6GJE4_9PLEO|nr:hypothetical protein PMIN01_04278 [Paraphaeosphaeria minitans]